VVRARPRRPGLAIGGRRGPWPQAQRRAAPNSHADSGGPAPQGQAAVPGTGPRPVPILMRSPARGHSRSGGLTSPREGPVRPGSRRGRVVRRCLLLFRGGGPAGVGRTWDGASAPSPQQWRRPRADLVWPPDPPPGRGVAVGHRGSVEVGRGRRPIKASGCRGCGRGHPPRALGPLTMGCHRCGWPRGLPLGLGSPAAPWLSASRSG